MNDIRSRLRIPCFENGIDEGWIDHERNEAADTIDKLEAEVSRLQSALIWMSQPDAGRCSVCHEPCVGALVCDCSHASFVPLDRRVEALKAVKGEQQ